MKKVSSSWLFALVISYIFSCGSLNGETKSPATDREKIELAQETLEVLGEMEITYHMRSGGWAETLDELSVVVPLRKKVFDAVETSFMPDSLKIEVISWQRVRLSAKAKDRNGTVITYLVPDDWLKKNQEKPRVSEKVNEEKVKKTPQEISKEVYCGKCGAKNPATAKFCAKCGNKLKK